MSVQQPGERVRIRVVRRIDADPTSTALLLAGPAGLDLWPGLRRVGEADGRVLVETRTGEAGAEPAVAPAAVRALPPRRTPTSYVTRFQWTGEAPSSGELTLAYAPNGDGTPSTHAALTLESRLGPDCQVCGPQLRQMAEGFLENLARAAEARNRAA